MNKYSFLIIATVEISGDSQKMNPVDEARRTVESFCKIKNQGELSINGNKLTLELRDFQENKV